ncbi:Ig-like domain-containing protein, partial [Neorhizobium sp. T786]|uniref:Ig-like domain-containing protein n=1 Tax=Pseudorhizobium xiangyangii TaxID=2883104 RepID=UPI001CFF6494
SGTAEAGAIVRIYDGVTYLGQAVASDTGEWSYTASVQDGLHSFTVTATDKAGNVSAASEPFAITVSTAVPGTPSITSVSDDHGVVTGSINNGGVSDDVRPQIKGSASAGATINIYDNGAWLGQVTADGSGNWSFTPGSDLIEGGHAFTAKIVDGGGIEGLASFPHSITIDTTA